MANMKEIRRRIRSIESTRQITRAMELIASSRLRRARTRAEQARPCMDALQQSAGRLLAALGSADRPGRETAAVGHCRRPWVGRRL